MTNRTTPSEIKEIPFGELLNALQDDETILNPRYLYRLSDLEGDELEQLKKTWPKISLLRRQALMEDLEHLAEINNLLSFESICRYALADDDPKVRFFAVRSTMIYEGLDLWSIYLDMLENDPDVNVRAVSASALGQFVYLGEIDKLSKDNLRLIENGLLKVVQGTDNTEVRRRALEALGYSSRKEIPPLIEEAYISKKTDWMISALFAMGRSYNKNWNDKVLEMLESENEAIRHEAVKAAGELELSDAVPILIEYLEDDDWNVHIASIWSLSQIGGPGIEEALEIILFRSKNEEEIEHLEAALDNLAFTQGLPLYGILDYPEDQDVEEWINEIHSEDNSKYTNLSD
jgi:HEAT repeat protein